MDATSVNSAATSALSQSASQKSGINSDYQTFLRMLTVQLQNQDPLSPVSSDDFAVQLATFSQVEQQTLTNDLIRDQTAMLVSSNIGDMATWVGREARLIAPAYFDGATQIEISPNPIAVAEKTTLVVKDEWGSEVQRRDIAVSSDPYHWDGLDENGTPLPSGTYSFFLENYVADELTSVDPVEIYAEIAEVQMNENQSILVLANGATAPMSAATALRDVSQ